MFVCEVGCPVQGLVYAERGNLTEEKAEFARPARQGTAFENVKLEDAIAKIKPTAVVGATAKRGTFSSKVVQASTKVRP